MPHLNTSEIDDKISEVRNLINGLPDEHDDSNICKSIMKDIHELEEKFRDFGRQSDRPEIEEKFNNILSKIEEINDSELKNHIKEIVQKLEAMFLTRIPPSKPNVGTPSQAKTGLVPISKQPKPPHRSTSKGGKRKSKKSRKTRKTRKSKKTKKSKKSKKSRK